MEIDAPEPVSPVALLLCLAQQVQLEASEILHLCCYPPDILVTALDAAPILAASIRAQLGTTAQLSPTDVQNAYAHRVMLVLTLLETAWYQKEESLSEKQRMSIGCEVGKVGIEVLQGILWQQDEDAKEKRLKDAMMIGRHTRSTEEVSPPRKTRSGVKRKMSEEVNAVSSSGKKRSRKPQDAAEDIKQLSNLHDSAKSIKMMRRTSSMRLDFPEDVDATDVKPVKPNTQNVKWERARIAAQEERDKDCRAILFRVEEVVSRSVSREWHRL
jgi:Asp-tRNA(Asn)/Glu-tRNA(Gln) amidotransferase C subunit